MIDEPKYFNTYSFDISQTLLCNGVDMTSVITSTLSRGSPAGFFAENFVAKVLKDHADHVPSRGYDLLSNDGIKIEIKGLNQNGVDLSPSEMKGKGRKFNREQYEKESIEKDFIIADTSNLSSEIKFFIVPGEFVVTKKHRWSYKQAYDIVNDNQSCGVKWNV